MGEITKHRGIEEASYRHLFFKPRKIKAHENPVNIAIRSNKCVQVYFSTLRKSDGEPSKKTYYALMTALRRFLDFNGIKATDHALDDLIESKVRNPTDMSAERMVSLFRARFGDQATCPILGLYHRNFADLRIHISIKSSGKTIPLSEPQLLAIYNDPHLSKEHHLIIDLMAYSGERISALGLTPLENVHLVEGTGSALIDVEGWLNKTDTNHPCIIPKEFAERILENAQDHRYGTLFPNHKSLFQHITKVALQYHSVRFTSHYLRKRFQTVGETTSADDMSPNHWTVLMGDRPNVGHIPKIYSLMENHETIEEYEQFLVPRLRLGQRLAKTESNTRRLERENLELKARLDRLLALIEVKLALTPTT